MKYVALTVLFTIMQTPSPVPRKAPNHPARASQTVKQHRQTDQKPAAQPSSGIETVSPNPYQQNDIFFGSIGSIPCHGNLLYHRISLLLNGLERSKGSPHTETADYKQSEAECPSGLIHPVLRYRHGGKFADSYGLLCIWSSYALTAKSLLTRNVLGSESKWISLGWRLAMPTYPNTRRRDSGLKFTAPLRRSLRIIRLVRTPPTLPMHHLHIRSIHRCTFHRSLSLIPLQ